MTPMHTMVNHKNEQSVNLISLDKQSNNSALCKKFTDLGKTVNVIDLKQWQDSFYKVQTIPVIIFLIDHAVPNMQSKLDSIASISLPFLAIYSYPAPQLIKKIIISSVESCVWPCQAGELEYRLERLSLKLNKLANQDQQADKWFKLNLVGDSRLFKKSLRLIESSAHCDVPILIEGETGTGKEMAARAIHNLCNRKNKPFIAVNCGAIPDQLFENELFGHEKGAYTDARQIQDGLVIQANEGILFLDEIESLSEKGQVTLLRFIEDKLFKPLGANKSKHVNVRIIAASNISLSELVDKGMFRQDLFYRLNLISIKLPSLREREGDIKYLTEYFLNKFRIYYQQPDKYISPAIDAWILNNSWPGNVRELENYIHRLFIISDDLNFQQITEQNDEQKIRSRRKLFDRRINNIIDVSFNQAKNNVINQFEENYLIHLISSTYGNVTQAADIAQKERRSFGKLLKKHQIDPNQFRLTK